MPHKLNHILMSLPIWFFMYQSVGESFIEYITCCEAKCHENFKKNKIINLHQTIAISNKFYVLANRFINWFFLKPDLNLIIGIKNYWFIQNQF